MPTLFVLFYFQIAGLRFPIAGAVASPQFVGNPAPVRVGGAPFRERTRFNDDRSAAEERGSSQVFLQLLLLFCIVSPSTNRNEYEAAGVSGVEVSMLDFLR
jgi:hypothetical protein